MLEEARFSVTYSGNDDTIISDKKGFLFLLGPIISNSAKYAAKDVIPAIQFSVMDNAESEQITLSVRDNGTGIPRLAFLLSLARALLGDR